MVGNGLMLLQEFLAPVCQLGADEFDAGGLLDGPGFNLAGVMIAQLVFGQFNQRMVRMGGKSFTEFFQHLNGGVQVGGGWRSDN